MFAARNLAEELTSKRRVTSRNCQKFDRLRTDFALRARATRAYDRIGVTEMSSDRKLPWWLKPANHVVITLQRLGLAVGTMHLISVPGRKSGKLRTTPVSPLTVDATSSLASTGPTGLRTYGWPGGESSPVVARRNGRPWSRLAPYFAFLVLGSPDLMIFWFFAVTTKC